MRKFFLLSLVLFFVGHTLTLCDLQAQNVPQTKKEKRRAERRQAEEEHKIAIRRMLEKKNFSFNATELESSGHAAISNIRLNSLWYVNVNANVVRCYLPIYGTSPTSRPSILRRLDISSESYKYNLEVQGRGYLLTIKMRDSRSNTEYRFLFDIPFNGKNVRLNLSSTFTAPVSFRGDILK